MNSRRLLAAATALALTCGCGDYQTHDEREATQFIQALSAGNLAAVRGDIAPSVHVSQAQVEAIQEKFRDQGRLLYVHGYSVDCPDTWECFHVGFERRYYLLVVSYDKSRKINAWWIYPLKSSPQP